MQRFPLVGAINKRPYTADSGTTDQRFIGCYFVPSPNQATGARAMYCQKRAGLAAKETTGSGAASTGVFVSTATGAIVGAFGTSSSTIYKYTGSGSTNLGTITGRVQSFAECTFSTVTYILMVSSDQTGWFWASDATDTAISGDTHTNNVIDNITGLTGSLYVGQKITGTGIQANTRIASITSATAITTTIATTASATVAITVELVAKLINANFPTGIVGKFAELDGYVFVMSNIGRVYNSDLNSVVAWTAGAFMEADTSNDVGRGVARYRNMIIGIGAKSIEFYENAGNSPGSVLKRLPGGITHVGAASGSDGGLGSSIPLYCEGFDTVFFFAEDRNAYVLDGMSAKKLSGPEVFTPGSLTAMQAFSHARTRMINFTTSGSTIPRWLDIDSGMFNEPGFANRTYLASYALATGNDIFATDGSTGGKFFGLNNDNTATFQDDGAAFTMTIQTTKIDHGSEKRKFVTRIDLIADNQASGTTQLEYSDDDYATWRVAGNFDMTQSQKSIYRVGSHDGGRAYRLTHSANTAFRAQFLDIYFSEASW